MVRVASGKWLIPRALIGTAVSALLLGCSGLLPTSTSHIEATATPGSTVSPTARPRATQSAHAPRSAQPTGTPRVVTRLVVSDVTYSATGCWSSDWYDSEGHNTPGMAVKFTAKVTNEGDNPDTALVITHRTTDWFDTTPGLARHSWPDAPLLTGIRTLQVLGPVLKPGHSAKIRWTVVFHTPFDVHHTITFSTNLVLNPEVIIFESEEVWTASRVC